MKKSEYAELYINELLTSVIPFWEKHSPDPDFGGYFHCFDADGTLVNTDKNMWPQARQIWIFSWLYNQLEQKPKWINIAKCGVDFIKKYGQDENGDWYFCLSRDGSPVVQPHNIFSDFFAVIGLAEYSKASGNQEALDIALATFDRIQQRRDNPKGRYNKAGEGAKPFKNLAFPMIDLNVMSILSGIAPDREFEELIRHDIDEVMNRFVDNKNRIIRENVLPDGKFDESSYEGRHVNPGHGIEAMWFIMDLAQARGETNLIRRCCEIVKWGLEFGWDNEQGGLFYFMDVQGKPHIELQWDMKLWWPHLEALIACLKGYLLTGDVELWHWFKRLHDYTWSHFPDPDYMEWFGYLSRKGEVNNRCKANRWKVCFHLPRALYMIHDLFNKLPEGDLP